MAKVRREMEGAAVAYLARLIPVSLLDAKKLEQAIDLLNPFKDRKPESEAMRKHKAMLAQMRFQAAKGD